MEYTHEVLSDKELEKAIFFLRKARLVAEQSKCASRKVGAVLVRRDSVISEGYNGSPKGVNLCQTNLMCPRRAMGFSSGEGIEHCPAVHAEMNTVIQAAANGIETYGSTLYCYCGRPCKACMGILINAGVKRIFAITKSDNSGQYDEMSGKMAEDAGIDIVYIPQEAV